ncbi:MAG: holo-ACP synthase [Treponema sp.]|jgi:holo-[acyl-carrier protein] synthase|nr:holo-ACP synthase [Treponema sp.]
MIIGVGIDIIEVKRMEKWLVNKNILERYFHAEELKVAYSRGKAAALFLAARFAAKEAFGKAIGTGLANLTLKDILVVNKDNGKPEMRLTGSAEQALEKSGAEKIHISLTHEKNNAVAMVVLEGK